MKRYLHLKWLVLRSPYKQYPIITALHFSPLKQIVHLYICTQCLITSPSPQPVMKWCHKPQHQADGRKPNCSTKGNFSTTFTYTLLQMFPWQRQSLLSMRGGHCHTHYCHVTCDTRTTNVLALTQWVGNSSIGAAAGVVGAHTVALPRHLAAASTDCSSRTSPASGQGFDQQTAVWRPVRAEGAAGVAAGRTGRPTDHTYQLVAVPAGHRTHCRSVVVQAAQASGQPTAGACLWTA